MVSTVTEIQEAIVKLSADEKAAIASWLESQQEPEMSPAEEAELLASLDKGIQQLKAGQGVPIEQVRGMVRKWASK